MHESILHQGIELNIKTVVDDTEKQISDIEEFIAQGVDLLIVSPNKAAPITSVIEKAYYSGIPVILVDRKILSDKYTAFIGADNYEIGKEVGNYVVNLLKEKGNIVEIRGLEGSTPAMERHQGFFSVIAKYPGIKIVSDTDGAWLKDVAENKMEEALRDSLPVDLVYAHNDRMAIGAYNAAKQQGKAKDIYFIGIDALPGKDGGIEQVLDNKLEATFAYPTGGEKIIQLAMNILEKKPYEKYNPLYTYVVNKSNARVLKLQSDQIIEQENKINFLNERVDTFLSQYNTQRYMLFSSVFIVLLLVVFFVIFYFAYRSKNRLNKELEIRNNEINEQKNLSEQQRDQLISLSKQLEDATHAKLVFFTNISHEFRTPLTLISGPVSSLLADEKISMEQKRLLSLIQKNVRVLLKLIDQIIDFRKYENGKLTLNITQNDLRQQIIGWNESFMEIFKKKNISLIFNHPEEDNFIMNFDEEKMERVYFNLLSNAFKFTPEKGKIVISLEKEKQNEKEYAVITIANSGTGISKQDIHNIFDRFYQIDSRMAGSGIGLALAKSLIELHDGMISAESESGLTTFTVKLPIDKSGFFAIQGHNTRLQTMSDVNTLEDSFDSSEKIFIEDKIKKGKELVLVVDDNPDIRSYIRTILSNHYEIIEAKDGEEGFKKAVKHVPDIIVCDVMMPKMNGVELCGLLKNELSTGHIPIILLTARSLDEQRIEGFKSGADDYISKPFNSDVLESRISNLIENRKHLRELLQKNVFTPESKEMLNEVDENFLEKLRTLIEENLSDSNLNVEDLGQHIGLSRTQLYRKVKSLTNFSPNELLRIMRLKKAFVLLSSSDLNIAEVAYDVGFTSPSYFAKCFKEYYNESPTDYLKRIR